MLTVIPYSQVKSVTVFGLIKDKTNNLALPYFNVVLKTEKDSTFITGAVSNEEGRFSLVGIKPRLGITILFFCFTRLIWVERNFFDQENSILLDFCNNQREPTFTTYQ
ncbi:MAG: hypothetical protein ORN54_10750 [Cyclobacteriaceae bacterium]|nr:hypothetical protein [Cyclobacteriaceae bacterium]